MIQPVLVFIGIVLISGLSSLSGSAFEVQENECQISSYIAKGRTQTLSEDFYFFGKLTRPVSLMEGNVKFKAGTDFECKKLKTGFVRLEFESEFQYASFSCSSHGSSFFLEPGIRLGSINECILTSPIKISDTEIPSKARVRFSRNGSLLAYEYYRDRKSYRGSFYLPKGLKTNLNEAVPLSIPIQSDGSLDFYVSKIPRKNYFGLRLSRKLLTSKRLSEGGKRGYPLRFAFLNASRDSKEYHRRLDFFIEDGNSVDLFVGKDEARIVGSSSVDDSSEHECIEVKKQFSKDMWSRECLLGSLVNLNKTGVDVPNLSFSLPIKESTTFRVTEKFDLFGTEFKEGKVLSKRDFLAPIIKKKVELAKVDKASGKRFEKNVDYSICGKIDTVKIYSSIPEGIQSQNFLDEIELCAFVEAGFDWNNLAKARVIDFKGKWIKIEYQVAKQSWRLQPETKIGWVDSTVVTTPYALKIGKVEYPIPFVAPETIYAKGSEFIIDKGQDGLCFGPEEVPVIEYSSGGDETEDSWQIQRVNLVLPRESSSDIEVKRYVKSGKEFECST